MKNKRSKLCNCDNPFLNFTFCILIFEFVSCCSASPAAADEKMTAIKGGDLYTITSGIIKNGTILIKDGKISRIGQNIEIPKDAEVIDARGKVVMPGLVAATTLLMGLRSSGDINKIADSLDPFEFEVSLALASGVTTAFVTAAPPRRRGESSGEDPIGGTNAVIKMAYGDLDNMLIKEPVAENVSISNWQWLRKAIFLLNLRRAKDYLQKLAEYQKAKDKDSSRRLAEPDKKLEEPKKPADLDPYIRLLRRELPARLEAATADDILAALELVDEFGIRIILEGGLEAWIVAQEIAKRDVSLIITPRDRQEPRKDISGPSGSTMANAAILKKAGVRFAIVPQGPYFGLGGMAGRDLMALPMEAAFAVSGGLDEQTALEAITLTAAQILGVADRVGSLQVGKDADIIILDGHPFHYRSFVELTLINGKILYDKKRSTYFSHITHDN
jgi:imidazolonepropionase-like amidohydrolase